MPIDLGTTDYTGYVGMFDSGVGGISVLKEARALLPSENFLFFGDSANTPYGEKSKEWIYQRSRDITQSMLNAGCKAIVIACNTATSAAADRLREEYTHVPIVGIEPALKPAATQGEGNRILVMATPVTIELDKFRALYAKWGQDSQVYVVPCEGLANRVEKGRFEDDDLRNLLEGLIGAYRGRVDSVVLGCTHYPFVKKQVVEVLGGNVEVFDGGAGTARQLARLLAEGGLLAPEGACEGSIVLRSSIDTPETLALYRWLLDQPIPV